MHTLPFLSSGSSHLSSDIPIITILCSNILSSIRVIFCFRDSFSRSTLDSLDFNLTCCTFISSTSLACFGRLKSSGIFLSILSILSLRLSYRSCSSGGNCIFGFVSFDTV